MTEKLGWVLAMLLTDVIVMRALLPNQQHALAGSLMLFMNPHATYIEVAKPATLEDCLRKFVLSGM